MKHLFFILILGFLFQGCGIFENEQDLDLSDTRCEESFFIVVEQMPTLIGGLAELQRKVVYPDEARKQGVEGRVTVQFLVSKEGNVICPKVIRGLGPLCNAAAIKAVNQAKFTPGMQAGEPVRVQYSLPIVFRLQN